MDSSFSFTNVSAAVIFFPLLCTILFLFYRKFRPHQENKKELASSLSLLSPLPSLPQNWIHHVFPSFHGADVRKALLGHILKEFRSKGIDPFIDNNIERGKSIGPELIDAIRGSRIGIVLLSKNYASSTWCLDELVEIIRCREVLGQTVMVLFYEVDPTDVKKQTGHFGKVFRKTCKGKTKDNIERWKQALAEVAKIAGYHSSNWDNESKMIEDIAVHVSNKLNLSTPSRDFDNLVGMETHMFNMEPLLRLDLKGEVRMIGIWGPSGIGKTTIARFLFNQYSKKFQLCVFMENVKRIPIPDYSDDYSVKLNLQETFMSKIISQEGFKIPHLGIVKDRLKDKKVLVVLDDVDRPVQLEAMAEKTNWFGPGSRIIITTQDRKILQGGEVNHTYKVDLPSSSEAFQMFCKYAFGQKYPKDGFTELAWEVTRLAGELPLGLRVMGSYFRGMSNQEDWRKALPRLKTRPDGEIESILKFSFDALGDEDKHLFLHIACFFYNMPIDEVEGCLANSRLIPDVILGLDILTRKSLISLDRGVVRMHNLLILLGRGIVRKQSINQPEKRQFLVETRDIDEVFSDDKADASNVIGIDLTSSSDNKEDITCTSEGALERFYNLQFLNIGGKGINMRSLNSMSQKLRYLSWSNFPLPCFPSDFQPKLLVKLRMYSSHLEKLWEENQTVSNLKWIDLRSSRCLKVSPDLSTAINLCELHLSDCSSLVKLHPSIGNAINLQKLNLAGCGSLVELPYSIGNLINLEYLNLLYCSSLVELPSSMKNLCRLSDLKLEGCSNLEVCLTNINLEWLYELDLSGCSFLKIEDLKPSGTAIKEVPLLMMTLYELEMSECGTQELGPWIGRICRLRRLVLNKMQKLVSLPQLPYSISELDVNYCESLEKLECSFRHPNICLKFARCNKLNQEARDLIIHTRTNKYVVLPGGEVPTCFTYRASGSSLIVKLNQNHLLTSTKFRVCFILADESGYAFKDKENKEVYCSITYEQNYVSFSTLVLHPFSEHLYIFEVAEEETTSTEVVFEFESREDTWGIRECGVMQLLEVPSER